MAKRFGRNQKRKLKARITELEEKLNCCKALLIKAYNQNSELKYQLETIIEELQKINKYCALLPPKTIKAGHKESDYIEVALPLSMEELMNSSTHDLIVNRKVLPFLRMFLSVHKNIDLLSRTIHLRVQYDGQRIGYNYAVSHEALKLFPKSVAEEVQYKLKKLLPIAIKKLINGGKYALV